jgi:hypothetical protein
VPRLGDTPTQHLPESITEPLRGQAMATGVPSQGLCSQQHAVQQSRWNSMGVPPPLLRTNPPGVPTQATLSPAASIMRNGRSATGRFRVQDLHAREVSTSERSKWAIHHAWRPRPSTELFCLYLIRQSDMFVNRHSSHVNPKIAPSSRLTFDV